MSEWPALAIAMLCACMVVILVAVLRHRRLASDEDPSETPDVIEYVSMMIGVIYAVVLGLAIQAERTTRGGDGRADHHPHPDRPSRLRAMPRGPAIRRSASLHRLIVHQQRIIRGQ